MKIAYNPLGSGALLKAPDNKDITFDLVGKVIYALGVPFDGKDTKYTVFKKHISSDNTGGSEGLVPIPSYSTTNNRLLREDGLWVNIAGVTPPDTELSTDSTNAVQNKVITNKINEILASIQLKAADIYKNVKVGNTTLVASGINDTLEFKLGNGIIITPNAANKTLEFSINATGNLGINTSYDNKQLVVKILDEYYNKWNAVYNWYISVTQEDTDNLINKWLEIVDFLNSVAESTDILDEFVTRKTNLTIIGKKIFSHNEYGESLTIHRNLFNYDSVIKFSNNEDGLLGYIGIGGSGSESCPLNPYWTNGTNAYKFWHEGNDGHNSGLDADTVDGYDSTAIFKFEGTKYTDGASTLWDSFGSVVYSEALPDGLKGVYNYGQAISFGGSNAKFDIYVSHVSTDASRDATNGGIYVRSGWKTDKKSWRKLAFMDSNVSSASKLQTARTIWGQLFDGTEDVSGHIYLGANAIFGYNNASVISSTETNLSVGYGQSTNGISLGLYGNEVNMYYGKTGLNRGLILNSSGNITIGSSDLASTNYKLYVNGSSFSNSVKIGGAQVTDDSKNIEFLASDATVRARISYNGNTSDGLWHFDAIYTHMAMATRSGTYLGVGTTSPSAKLHVAGNILATGGFLKLDSSNDYILLGGGGHKLLSDFGTGGPYLPLSGGVLSDSIFFGGESTTSNSTGQRTRLPSHIYRNVYDTSGNVYDHYYNLSYTASTNTFANLRVKASGGAKVLRFGGDGTFTWDGNNVIHSGNIGSQSVSNASTADKLKNKVKIWGLDFDGSKDVNGSIFMNNDNSVVSKDTYGNNVIILNFGNSNALNLGYGAAGFGYATFVDGKEIYLRYGTSRTTGIILGANGNVGIGTSSPGLKLLVEGHIALFESLDFTREFYNYITVPSNKGLLAFNIGAAGTANTKMLINNSGDVSIGNTDPKYKLHVSGSIYGSYGKFGGILINKGYDTNVGTDTIETATSGNMLYINYYHNGGLNLCLGGGKVGIGTTNPQQKLHVVGSVAATTSIIGGYSNTRSFHAGGGGTYAWIDSRDTSNKVMNNIILHDDRTSTKILTPHGNNTYSLGTSSLRWSNVYSVLGNFTGSVTFANGTWNAVGDDAAIGDYNDAGMLGLKSINNNIPGIGFHNSSNTLLGRLQANGSNLLWNYNKIWHAGNDGIGSGLDADLLDGIDSAGFLRQVIVPNNTENDFNTFSNMTLTGRVDPTTGASLKNAPWSGSGPAGGYGVLTYLFNGSGYGTQMAWGYHDNRIYIRNKYWGGSGVGSVWSTSWAAVALTSDIPTVTNYYWANIPISATSSTTTTPTFGGVTVNGTSLLNGLVGIGILNPKAKLAVNISANSTNPASGSLGTLNTMSVGAAGSYGTYFWTRGTGKGYIQVGREDGTATVYDLILQVLGGNVGIGIESPSYKLDVTSSARVASIVMEINDEINRYGGNLYLLHRGTIAGSLGDARTGNICMCTNGGSVGIGTTKIQQKFHVSGISKFESTSNIPILVQSTTSVESSIAYYGKDNYRWVAGQGTAGISNAFGIWSDTLNANTMTILSSGNVGIGTTSPSYKLHVAGDSYATGWSRAGSGFYVEGKGVHYMSNNASGLGQIYLTSNEFNWSASETTLYFNYRASANGKTVTSYIWNGGSSSTYATHTLGALTSRGDLTLYGLTQTCNKANDANYMNSALLIREYNFGGSQSDTWAIAPRLSWHWGGRVLTLIGLASGGDLYLSKNNFTNAYLLLHLGNTSITDYNVKIGGTTRNFVRDWGQGATDMNAVARGGRSSMGMAHLATPSDGTATAVNPNGGTSWHHFINISYTEGGGGSNAWITLIANMAGTTDLWVRSRSGGTISDTAAWTAGWTRILTGSNYTNITDGRYIKKSGDTMSSGTAQIQRAGSSVSWYLGRSNAMIRINSYSGYNAIASLKTTNGDWSMGVYADNKLYFSYVLDAHYNAGTNQTTGLVVFAPNAYIYAGHFYEHSDIRLKNNISNILTSDNIPQLKKFNWNHDDSIGYGLIAQDLEEMGYPELVSIKDDGYKTVDYSAALSLIVGKLQVKIKELEKEIEILKNKN